MHLNIHTNKAVIRRRIFYFVLPWGCRLKSAQLPIAGGAFGRDLGRGRQRAGGSEEPLVQEPRVQEPRCAPRSLDSRSRCIKTRFSGSASKFLINSESIISECG